MSITEGPKNKSMRKSGINSSVPCWDSTLEQFLFYRVSGKNAKVISYEATDIAQYIDQSNTSAIKESPKKHHVFQFFWTPSKTKIVLTYCPDITMDARFPHNFVFWALSNAHN